MSWYKNKTVFRVPEESWEVDCQISRWKYTVFEVQRLYRHWIGYFSSQHYSCRKFGLYVKYTVLTGSIRSSSWKSTVFSWKVYGLLTETEPTANVYAPPEFKRRKCAAKVYDLPALFDLFLADNLRWIAIESKSFEKAF